MKMVLQGNTLRIKDADNVQFTVIKSWNKMRWVAPKTLERFYTRSPPLRISGTQGRSAPRPSTP